MVTYGLPGKTPGIVAARALQFGLRRSLKRLGNAPPLLLRGPVNQHFGSTLEHVFVTAQGTTYSQFKRALERRNFMLAWKMAAELPQVPLADGLELLLLAHEVEPVRFDRAVAADRQRRLSQVCST